MDAVVDTLLVDFARLSIASTNTNKPARFSRRRSPKWSILCAGLVVLIVTLAVYFCLQPPHQPLQLAPAMLSGSHICAASKDLAEVCSTSVDQPQDFGSAEPALHRAAILHSLSSAVQPAVTAQAASMTATGSAWAGTETLPVAPAEKTRRNTSTETGASEFAQARTLQDSEATCLKHMQAATSANNADAAATQFAEMAPTGVDIGAGVNQIGTPVFEHWPRSVTPELQPMKTPLAQGMAAANVFQAVVALAVAGTVDRNPAHDIAHDIAAAALAFKPLSRWHVQDSVSSAPDAAEADSHQIEDLLMPLPIRQVQQMAMSSTSKLAAAVAATAQLIEASASVTLTSLVAFEELMHIWVCHITRCALLRLYSVLPLSSDWSFVRLICHSDLVQL